MANSSRVKPNVVYQEFTVLSVGDMEEGFSFYGPFGDNKAAADWAKDNIVDGHLCKVVSVNDVRPVEDSDDPTG